MQLPLRIRTITAFVGLPTDEHLLPNCFSDAAAFLRAAQLSYEAQGYEVQTIRIATSSVQERCNGPQHLHRYVRNLAELAKKDGISFLSVGAFNDPAYLDLIPSLIAKEHVSCSYTLPPSAEPSLCSKVAQAILEVSADTDGAGNFRFCAAANCSSGIPFFPVAAAAPGAQAFAIGTENDTIMFNAFTTAAQASSSAADVLTAAFQHLYQQMTAALMPVQDIALQLASKHSSWSYLGIDTSIAPGLDTPSMTSSYRALGLGGFGGYGTLAASALITRALKTLPVRMTGYCGLMLAVCEDAGLAESAAAGDVSISDILQYSVVCGCGLDTVPVPGPSSQLVAQRKQQQDDAGDDDDDADDDDASASLDRWPEGDQQLCSRIAMLLLDVAALAYRLNKPLGCRLLPLPGKVAGDATGFNNPYLLDSKVMALD